jgi:aspartate/methionine/tyrosine aminotransferase
VAKYFTGLTPDEIFPYAPTFGLPNLRERWAKKLVRDNPALDGNSFSLPVVTSGITHGISLAGDLFVNPGDTVLLPDKLWGNYLMIFGTRLGAKIDKYPFFTDELTGFNTAGFRRKLEQHSGAGKLVILLNFPHNPTGYSVTGREAREIVEAIEAVADKGCNVVVVLDDSYFGLFYAPDVFRESLFSLLADCDKRILAVKLDGATKEDYVWGFRTGFISFSTVCGEGKLYEALVKKTGGAIRGGISNCPLPSQSILLKSMSDPDYLAEKKTAYDILKKRAMAVNKVLSEERFKDVWEPYPFNSGYFMCLRLKTLPAEKFRLHLLEKYGIGVISTSETDIRVAFSCIEAEQIPDLFEQMYECALEMAQK